MNKEPETYEELIRKQNCIKLTDYYNLTEKDLDIIYNFLTKNETGTVNGLQNQIYLSSNGNIVPISSMCKKNNIARVYMSNDEFFVINDSSSGESSSGGGSSSNNNNNNNNNNNR